MRTAAIALLASAWGCGGAQPEVAPGTGVPGATTGGESSPVALVVPAEMGDRARALARDRPHVRVHVVEAEPGAADVARAREMVTGAWERYIAIEFEDALAAIREAVVLLESHARSREDFDLLAEALLVRGMAELALGRDEAARESFLAAARLRPERQLEEGRYPPQVRERYEQLRSELRAEPASSLTITTRPGGASLVLDGEPRGSAPDTLYATSGRHQLRVEAPGYASRTLTVTFDPGGGQLEVELPQAEPAVAARQVLEGEPAEAVRDPAREALRGALGVSTVVRIVPHADAFAATRLDLARGLVDGAEGAELAPLVDAFAVAIPETAGGETPPAGDPEAFHNEGFFARAALGFSLRTDELADMDQNARGGSLAGDFELSAGGSLAPGVVLGGALLALLGGPTLRLGGLEESEPSLGSVGGLAVFLAWYPGAEGGWHLYGAVGGSRGQLRDPGTDEEGRLNQDLVGGVLALGGGYEWWVASDWSVGTLVRLMGFTLRGREDVTWEAGGLSIVGTVTYN